MLEIIKFNAGYCGPNPTTISTLDQDGSARKKNFKFKKLLTSG